MNNIRVQLMRREREETFTLEWVLANDRCDVTRAWMEELDSVMLLFNDIVMSAPHADDTTSVHEKTRMHWIHVWSMQQQKAKSIWLSKKLWPRLCNT